MKEERVSLGYLWGTTETNKLAFVPPNPHLTPVICRQRKPGRAPKTARPRHSYIAVNTRKGRVYIPMAFPPRDHAKPAPDCVWEEVPGRELVSVGAAWEIVFSKRQRRQESSRKWPRLWLCAGAWITSIGFFRGLRKRGESANQTLSNILHAPHISGPTGCTLSKLETILQAVLLTDTSSPRQIRSAQNVSHVEPLLPSLPAL